jgi:hypothetical protein
VIVNGFIEPVTNELPMEYAVEPNRLIQLEDGRLDRLAGAVRLASGRAARRAVIGPSVADAIRHR